MPSGNMDGVGAREAAQTWSRRPDPPHEDADEGDLLDEHDGDEREGDWRHGSTCSTVAHDRG